MKSGQNQVKSIFYIILQRPFSNRSDSDKINKANSSKIVTSLWNTHIPWNNYETEISLKQELYAFDKPLKKSIKLIATDNLNYTSIFISLASRYIWGYQNWIYQPGFFSSKEQMSVFIILLLQILKFATMQHEI